MVDVFEPLVGRLASCFLFTPQPSRLELLGEVWRTRKLRFMF